MPQVLAHLHCIAPSGPLLNIERATRGLQWLENQGFVIHNATAANRQFERFAGSFSTLNFEQVLSDKVVKLQITYLD